MFIPYRTYLPNLELRRDQCLRSHGAPALAGTEPPGIYCPRGWPDLAARSGRDRPGRRPAPAAHPGKGHFIVELLDLTMPHLDGEETFRELRRLNRDVRVILSSGYNEQEVTQKFNGKGLSAFIQKPYRLASLKETLRLVLKVIGSTKR